MKTFAICTYNFRRPWELLLHTPVILFWEYKGSFVLVDYGISKNTRFLFLGIVVVLLKHRLLSTLNVFIILYLVFGLPLLNLQEFKFFTFLNTIFRPSCTKTMKFVQTIYQAYSLSFKSSCSSHHFGGVSRLQEHSSQTQEHHLINNGRGCDKVLLPFSLRLHAP